MSGFEWDGGIGDADLAAGKATQLYNICLELILDLDQRREWARCVIALNPELPRILRPEIQASHCFRKFQRTFVLEYRPETDVWRLRFIGARKCPPPPANDAGGAAQGPDGDGGPPGDAVACSALPRRRAGGRMRRWMRAVHQEQIEPRLGRLLAAIGKAAKSAKERLLRARRELRERRARIAAAIEAWRVDTIEEPFADAHFEPIRIALGGLTLDVTMLVRDRPDWDSWLFGRRVEEDLLLD